MKGKQKTRNKTKIHLSNTIVKYEKVPVRNMAND